MESEKGRKDRFTKKWLYRDTYCGSSKFQANRETVESFIRYLSDLRDCFNSFASPNLFTLLIHILS